MKLLFAILISILLPACAARTTFYDRKSGKRIAEFQGDMTGSQYSDAETSWNVATVSHSAATLAMGHSVTGIVKATGGAVAGVALAVGTSGASTGVGALAGKVGAVAVPISANATGSNPPNTPAKAH